MVERNILLLRLLLQLPCLQWPDISLPGLFFHRYASQLSINLNPKTTFVFGRIRKQHLSLTRTLRKRISQIEQVQRRAAHWTVSNFDRQASVTKIVQDLGWRTMDQRRADARLCLFFKIVHGLVAVPLPDYIQHSNRISRYCHSMTFRQVSTSTDYYKYSPPHNSSVECPPTACYMLAES